MGREERVVTRGQLGEVVGLMFQGSGRLCLRPAKRGNRVAWLESSSDLLLWADDAAIEYTGPDDHRGVPEPFAHRVVAILRATRGATPDLDGEMVEYMRHAGVTGGSK